MIHFVTSCGKNYSRPWIFPTLDKLEAMDEVVYALLQPGDDRPLPDNVVRVVYEGDRFYQDGLFLDAIETPGDMLPDDDIILLADADAIIQRSLSEKEIGLLEGLGDAFLIGPNIEDVQYGEVEIVHGLRMTRSWEDTTQRFGVSHDDLVKCRVYNWGLVAAKVGSWRKLRNLYRAMRGDRDPQEYFVGVSWMQYLLCVILHRHKIPVIDMPQTMHSHCHFGLRLEHGVEDRVLTYRGEAVFFAHYCPGVTHGRDMPREEVRVIPHVVWHVAAMNNWRAVATEQLALLKSVELKHVDVSWVGDLRELPWLFEEAAYHNVHLTVVSKEADVKVAEVPAITYVERLAKHYHTDRPILYMHTKGVSRPGDPKRWTWRRALQEFVVKRWKENLRILLDQAMDAVGFNWIDCGATSHFSGNFWLASPHWIRRLPDFRGYNRTKRMANNPRFDCESWIGASNEPAIHKLSVGCKNQPWEKTDFADLVNHEEHKAPCYTTFVTSSAKEYPKQWVWPSLHRISYPKVAFLHPKDQTELPPGVTRMDYFGDKFFYDGRFMPNDKDIRNDEVVVLFDVDGVFQREVMLGELDLPMDGVAAGWNSRVGEVGSEELVRLQPKYDERRLAGKIGLPQTLLRTAPIYNLGLVAARGSTWRFLQYLYNRHVWSQGPKLFGNLHFQQYLVCLLLAHYNIPVRSLGYEVHSHGHYRLQKEHNVTDGVLRYKDKVVLFAHNVKGTHP